MTATGPSTPHQAQALRVALRELYLRAGEPSMRAIAAACGPGVISHNTVHKVLGAPHAATQRHLAIVVGQLGGDVEAFREMWVAARLALGDVTGQPLDPTPASGPDSRLPPADELFLISHYGRDGRCAVNREALGIALAGAVLAELLEQGCLTMSSGRMMISGAEPRDTVGSVFRDRILALAASGGSPLDTWARQLRYDAVRLVSQRLADAGLIVPERVRRLAGWRDETRYPHTSHPQAKQPMISMRRQLLTETAAIDQQTSLLAALVLRIGAYRTMPIELAEARLRARLAALAAPLENDLRQIVAAVDTAVAKTTVTPNL